MITLPLIASVTPAASVAIGVGLLGETPKTGVVGAVAAGLAVLVASVALARLAREAPHPEPVRHEPARHEPVRHEPMDPEQAPERLPMLTGACR
jgi:hypothetical protein